jgi:hypothetical protein
MEFRTELGMRLFCVATFFAGMLGGGLIASLTSLH